MSSCPDETESERILIYVQSRRSHTQSEEEREEEVEVGRSTPNKVFN